MLVIDDKENDYKDRKNNCKFEHTIEHIASLSNLNMLYDDPSSKLINLIV